MELQNTEHPRLFINQIRINELIEIRKSDTYFNQIVTNLKAQADEIKQLPYVPFKITGPRMLKNCQEIHRRVRILSLMSLLNGDKTYAERAKDELLNAADYPHWNKDHFLDTAELITAFAIGYDWLYNILSKNVLEKIKNAMIEKGIRVGIKEHKNNIWWAQHKYNWNQVCNGGLIVGALAIADEEHELSSAVFNVAAKHLPIAFRSYGQDGGWEAGPEYWQYTTWFSVLLIDALQTSTGDDLGLSGTTGFDKTGLFPIYSAGPTEKYFNFADGDEDYHSLPVLFWLGNKFKLDTCIRENHRLIIKDIASGYKIDAFNLIWYQPMVNMAKTLPENRLFSEINAGYLRSEWNNPNATFIAFKGGSNQSDHAHLDLGTFVLDMDGERWALDLGRDNYDLPGYFDPSEGGGRWNYYRLNNKSHNTIILNDDIQRAEAKSNIYKFNGSKDNTYCKLDLTEAYRPHAKSVIRTFTMKHPKQITIQDKINWNGDKRKAEWRMTTDAAIICKGEKASLTKEGKKITANILKPEGACFDVLSARQQAPEKENAGINQLSVIVEDINMQTEIEIQFLLEE